MATRKAGIKKLKAHLSAYVKRAAKGDRLLITDRGEVVAELVPHHPDKPKTLVEIMRKLERDGFATLPEGFPEKMRRPRADFEPIDPPVDAEKFHEFFEWMRGDR
jgi:prevent-host-death family protein